MKMGLCLIYFHLLSHEAGGLIHSTKDVWRLNWILYSTWLPNLYILSRLQTILAWHTQGKLLFTPSRQRAPRIPGGTCTYQDVSVLRFLPWGWAGAVAEFEYPVVLSSDKEVSWQKATNRQAEEGDVGSLEALLGPQQAGWWAVLSFSCSASWSEHRELLAGL